MRGSRVAGLIVLAIAGAVMVMGAGAARMPDAGDPAWSPDGRNIAFAYFGSTGRLEVMNAGGTGKHSIYSSRGAACCSHMQWAAGGRIVFIDDFELFSVPAAGGRAKKLFTGTPSFTLSPNRETIAFDDGCGCGHRPDAVALVGVDGGKPLVIRHPGNTTDSIDGFSPDGTELVFTRAPWNYNGNAKGNPVLMVESVRGGAPVPLVRSGLIGASSLPADAVGPQWSPDGKWIAYVTPNGRLQTVGTSGGRPHALGPQTVRSFAWSPTSRRIAYFDMSGVTARLATVELNGNQKELSTGSLQAMTNDSWDRPQWAPNGTELVFTGLVGPNKGGRPPLGIWVVNADGTRLKKIA